MNIPTDERTSLDEHGRGGQSDCARAMAEAEKVLRELALFTRRPKPEHSNAATRARKAPALVPASFPTDRGVLAPAWILPSMRMGPLNSPESDSGAWRKRTPQRSTS